MLVFSLLNTLIVNIFFIYIACGNQVEERNSEEMRQSNAEGGLSPPLPAAVPPANMGIYEFKHADTDTENARPQDNVKIASLLYFSSILIF